MTVGNDRVTRIKDQLTWHKKIGGDANIPPGFHSFRKPKAWVVMVKAVQRHRLGTAHRKLKGIHFDHTQTPNIQSRHRTREDQ